jgi:hypothetical protein
MVELELKTYGSSDHDLEAWRPERDEDVFFVLDMEIGEIGDERADLFYITVATPVALRAHPSSDATSQGALVVDDYSLEAVLARVREIVSDCAAPT